MHFVPYGEVKLRLQSIEVGKISSRELRSNYESSIGVNKFADMTVDTVFFKVHCNFLRVTP